MLPANELVIGIDGGGSKTVAWIAQCREDDGFAVVGQGSAAGSNPQAVGMAAALEKLAEAVSAARGQAAVESGPVAAVVVGLAGSCGDDVQQVIGHWASSRQLAQRFRVVHDAIPVLAAGSPDGWGVALISGTGSFAFGQDHQGCSARAGGWGHILGDEGSGYAIAVAGLRAAARAADQRGPTTRLLDDFLARLRCSQPSDLISAIYGARGDAAAIARLSDVVFHAAIHADAQQIVADAATDLAGLVAAVATKLGFIGREFPLAWTGGVLLGNVPLADSLVGRLAKQGLQPWPVVAVPDPVAGAVRIAVKLRRESNEG